MAELAKHTPIPWHYRPTTIGHPDNRINPIICADQAKTGVAYIGRIGWQGSTIPGMTSLTPETFEEAEANIEFIVLAVNHHDRLIEALDYIRLKQACGATREEIDDICRTATASVRAHPTA